MIAAAIAFEIRRLLDEGRLSKRRIAEMLKVSRTTVSAIANRHRGLHGQEPTSERRPGIEFKPIPTRCPHCGGMVYAPCLLCEARAFRRRAAEEWQFRLRSGNRHPRRVA